MKSQIHQHAGSAKVKLFTESIFREVSRLANVHKAINLGPGLPDSLFPPELIEAAATALSKNVHQYAIIFGDRVLREAIAERTKHMRGTTVDPETEITVTCGATEALIAAMLAIVDPGDEVIIFEPFYESYEPNTILCGATPRHVKLNPPEWRFDEKELEAAFNNKTKVIVINSPQNPTGTVFSREELETIARLCQKWGVVAITDEIYEHIIYDEAEHISIATLPGMEELTVTAHSLSKTFSVTGWRVGWAISNPATTTAIRKVHDYLTAGAPAPLQRAAVTAMNLGDDHYRNLVGEYSSRREHFLETLDMAGVPYFKPKGAYYVLCDISKFGFENDVEFTKHLIENVGVAAVPASTFFRASSPIGKNFVRFCFSRRLEVLEDARNRIMQSSLHKS